MDIIVTIDGPPSRVDPGGETSTSVRVRNASSIVDEFYVTVVGGPERWTVVEPASVSLFPGTEGTVQLRFRPPRESSTPAGLLSFGVRATSRVDPTKSIVEPSTIEVLAFDHSTVDLVPKTSRAWRGASHTIRVANLGSRPIDAAVTATDEDQRLILSVTPARLMIGPGAIREATVSLRARSAPLFGATVRLPFAVAVHTVPGQPPIVTDGAFEQRPPLRRSPLPLLAVGAVALVGALVLTGILKIPGTDGTAKATISPTATPIGQTATPGASPACGNLTTTDVFFNLGSIEPTVMVDRDACLFRFVMYTPGSGSGPVSLKVEGVDFFRFEMAEYDEIGSEGAGSGERVVDLNPTVPVRPGQTISLDESGCVGDGCGQFSFNISAANAP